MGSALGWVGLAALAALGVNAVVQAEKRRAVRTITLSPVILNAATNPALMALFLRPPVQS